MARNDITFTVRPPLSRAELDEIRQRAADGVGFSAAAASTAYADRRALLAQVDHLETTLMLFGASLPLHPDDVAAEEAAERSRLAPPAGYVEVPELTAEHAGKEAAAVYITDGHQCAPVLGIVEKRFDPRTGEPSFALVSEHRHYQEARDLYGDDVDGYYLTGTTIVRLYVKGA